MSAGHVKVRVFIGHRPVGFLRWLTSTDHGSECVVTPSLARATKFENSITGFKDLGMAQSIFPQPERESEKKPLLPVTFQLIKV